MSADITISEALKTQFMYASIGEKAADCDRKLMKNEPGGLFICVFDAMVEQKCS
jgi:hypothetical protein